MAPRWPNQLSELQNNSKRRPPWGFRGARDAETFIYLHWDGDVLRWSFYSVAPPRLSSGCLLKDEMFFCNVAAAGQWHDECSCCPCTHACARGNRGHATLTETPRSRSRQDNTGKTLSTDNSLSQRHIWEIRCFPCCLNNLPLPHGHLPPHSLFCLECK